MLTKEQIDINHEKGYNCCMSVLTDVSERIGMDRKTAEDLGSLFGGGMGCGGACGCVSAAYMALGCVYGPNGKKADPDHIKEMRTEFNRRFKERFGSIFCKDILKGLNTSVPEENEIIMQKGLKKTICPYAMMAATEILEEML